MLQPSSSFASNVQGGSYEEVRNCDREVPLDMATVLVAVDEVYVQYAYALNGVDNEFMASCDRRPWCQCTPCSPCPMSRCPNSMAGRKLHGHVWAYSDAYDAEGVLEESKVLVPLAARQAGAVRGKHIASHGWHGATCQSNRPPHLVHQCNQIWGQHMPQWVGGDLGLFPIQPVPMQSCRCRSSCSHMPAQPKHMQQSLQPLLLRKQHPQLGSAGPRLHQGRLRSKPIHK